MSPLLPTIPTRAAIASSTPAKSLQRLGAATRWLFLAALVLLGAQTRPAQASLCVVPPENGAWVNIDPNTRGITRANFRMECRSRFVVTCNGLICSGHYVSEPHYFLRLFGKCHPTDCAWGEVEGKALTGSMAGWYYFVYNQGFAKRYVYVRTYPQYPGKLRIWISTDFTDPNRADYTSDEWFKH